MSMFYYELIFSEHTMRSEEKKKEKPRDKSCYRTHLHTENKTMEFITVKEKEEKQTNKQTERES